MNFFESILENPVFEEYLARYINDAIEFFLETEYPKMSHIDFLNKIDNEERLDIDDTAIYFFALIDDKKIDLIKIIKFNSNIVIKPLYIKEDNVGLQQDLQ